MAIPNYAFVTLVSSDSYLPGALALAGALKDLHPSPPVPPEVQFQIVCLVTPETVDVSTIKSLRSAFELVIGVEVIDQKDEAGLKLLGRLDLRAVLTKLHVFRLTQYSKIIFLDADVLPIRPLSHLFTLPYEFSAVPDVGWPDIFNSGVLVLSPGEDKFNELINLLKSKGSWDGGDQGILNEWRGGNWNRLSFTYNTTPTAAYTYAPAYERFGSQISAIHFIGPNKPWNTISYRTPFVTQSTPVSDSYQQAYDYNSLVDRWYEVYDRHHRSQSSKSQTPFEVQRYESAWNISGTSKKESLAPLPSGTTLSLEDLRQLAIKGMNAPSRIPHDDKFGDPVPGYGQYTSMPLEGRLDLMRPTINADVQRTKHQVQEKAKDKKIPEALKYIPEDIPENNELRTPVIPKTTPPRNFPPQDDTLPTPGPSDIPSSPRPHIIELPPVTPTPQYGLDSYHSPPQPESPSPLEHKEQPHRYQQDALRLSPFLAQPEKPSPHEYKKDFQSQGPQPYVPPPYHHLSRPESPSFHDGNPPLELQEHQQQGEYKSDLSHAHEPHVQSPLKDPPRPHSPTMLIWNAAVDPPPTIIPTPSAFPPDTYFPNIWDTTPSKQPDQARQDVLSPVSSASAFFEPLPRSEIPESLIKEGHYRNVTGEVDLGASPSPDRTKVKHVFPWEERPRHFPGRVFPAGDSPTPALFLSPESQTSSSEIPTTPERKQTHIASALSPLLGLPTSLTYTNAWDTVPSIQEYASKLIRPPPRPLAPAFDQDDWDKKRSKSWDERAEVSSRDGDVEDEGEDSINERALNDSARDDDIPKPSKIPRRRSRRGSAASAARTALEIKKQYREVGVQTTLPEMRAQGVQTASQAVKKDDRRSVEPDKKLSMSGKRRWAPSNHPDLLSPVAMYEISPGPELSLTTAAPSPAEDIQRRLEKPAIPSPSATIRFTDPHTPSPTGHRSPAKIVTPMSKPAVRTPHSPSIHSPTVVTRQISNDSSLGSPISSIGPISPTDGQPISPRPRKAGRVWDPARGVELFKRGSEEVLARFLKMGSWEDESR